MRIVGLTLLGIVVALALLIALAFPWGPIGGLQVERAELIATSPSERVIDPAGTPRQIAVTFTTPRDLRQVREAKTAEFINAALSACEKADVAQEVAVTQSAEMFRAGRVKALPSIGAGDARRYRYRATFDDWLPIPQGHGTEFVKAADVGGGLCFSLRGGAMFMGRLWSDRVPLTLVQLAR